MTDYTLRIGSRKSELALKQTYIIERLLKEAYPDLKTNERIKITTTFDGRGFDGVTHCKWEMQDSDGENCFPERDSLFCVTIDAKFKRK